MLHFYRRTLRHTLCYRKRAGLTAQLDPDEVFNPQVFEEHAAGGRGLEKEGNIGAELAVERREVEVRSLLIEVSSVPEVTLREKESIVGGC